MTTLTSPRHVLRVADLRPDELKLGRGETIADTARVLSGYAAAITVRTFAQAVAPLRQLAA
jgi:ornithine carbamoyltransferase